MVERYFGKISGPLLDRIDIHMEVPMVEWRELAGKQPATDSDTMREQVNLAMKAQRERFGPDSMTTNAKMSTKELNRFCKLDGTGERLLKQAMTELALSARAYDKVRRISRTIADMEDSESIQPHHVSEAIHYRLFDRAR
jgi:magnesium chelatase family protein